MRNLFRALSERLFALFATHVALDFEQQFVLHHSDRKVDLIRKAQELEEQGLHELASELRDQADSLSQQRPLASVLPAVEEFRKRLSSDALPNHTEVARLREPSAAASRRKPAKARRRNPK